MAVQEDWALSHSARREWQEAQGRRPMGDSERSGFLAAEAPESKLAPAWFARETETWKIPAASPLRQAPHFPLRGAPDSQKDLAGSRRMRPRPRSQRLRPA